MGGLISLLKGNNLTQSRILILGLDNSGKTSLIKTFGIVTQPKKKDEKEIIQEEDDISIIPTIGYNVKEVKYKGLTFNCWDLGGQRNIRGLWKHYYKGSNGIIYVVDSADRERLKESKQELLNLLEDQDLKSVPILIFANKKDKEGALTATELIAQFDLEENIGLQQQGRDWYVESISTLSGDGIENGLKWFASKIKKREKKKDDL
ncbi:hypothetical protein ABK040_007276 [Willaertia magna]